MVSHTGHTHRILTNLTPTPAVRLRGLESYLRQSG